MEQTGPDGSLAGPKAVPGKSFRRSGIHSQQMQPTKRVPEEGTPLFENTAPLFFHLKLLNKKLGGWFKYINKYINKFTKQEISCTPSQKKKEV